MKSFFALVLLASPVLADDYVAFQSPTGNIHCAIYSAGNGAEARCDLIDLVQSYPERPKGCDLDWGNAFAVGSNGRGALACVGDTVRDPRSPVLPYGEAVAMGGISCVSSRTGMTCTNADGHGFSVARAKQRLF
ncbi:MAG: hypothetical protein NTW20_10785 [Rhodobacterales bacterium]|nr:hypothetical protein [Rhodobacterales bacterium]